MAIKESSKKCYNCRYYKALYTKGIIEFNKLTLGLCRKQDNKLIEDKHGCCEHFTGSFYRIRLTKKVALNKLLEMSESVQAIRQILDELNCDT
ncbi:MAG: hypothetical protein J1F61_03625 [Clostridiales bacterium]|nr:hypothetical protein [Clostridiales bacterium]